MSPVNRSELSNVYVWSQIQYLDPDYEAFVSHIAAEQMRKKHLRRKRIVAVLLSLAASAGALLARYFHMAARLMN